MQGYGEGVFSAAIMTAILIVMALYLVVAFIAEVGLRGLTGRVAAKRVLNNRNRSPGTERSHNFL